MIKCNCLPFQLQSIVLGDGYIYEGGLNFWTNNTESGTESLQTVQRCNYYILFMGERIFFYKYECNEW